ncbi:hypothetical protein QTI66_38190 [Variovorax sp. J22R133]|uniref:hypothetical protein n=1 Tax=Variovorax brevis TaxID=3053503 RepID=UPI002575FC7A|nr:hypothetical protein [Variovorax sp. J22R133]MDM0117922.1 hypothetical protein [Variovorax sp. J22R133]
MAAFQDQIAADKLLPARSFPWTSIRSPTTASPVVQRHDVAMRSRRQASILTFMAHDAHGRALCYSNTDLRKGEAAHEIFNFISFREKHHGTRPRHRVFDSKLTTHANLARLDAMAIPFMTLRRRSPALLKEIALLPRSAWGTVEPDVPTRKHRTPRVFEQTTRIEGTTFASSSSWTSASPPSC